MCARVPAACADGVHERGLHGAGVARGGGPAAAGARSAGRGRGARHALLALLWRLPSGPHQQGENTNSIKIKIKELV